MSAALAYPAALPGPTNATTKAFERRLLTTAGPLLARDISRDQLYTQQLRFVFNAAQAAAFDDFWRNTLAHGGAWFSAPWLLPRGRAPVARRFDSTPRWSELGNGFWEVTVDCTARVVGLDPIDNTDPYWQYVVSLLDFRRTVSAPIQHGRFPHSGSTLVRGLDKRDVDWTLWAYNGDQPSIDNGQLDLPGLVFRSGADDGGWSGFSNGCFTSQAKDTFAAPGDFTMEFRHSTDNVGGNYSASSPIFIIGGCREDHYTGPTDEGEWAFVRSSDTLSFVVKGPGVSSYVAQANAYDYNPSAEVEVSITRKDGLLRIFVDGHVIAQQSTTAGEPTLYPQVTFGSIGTAAAQSNNFGYGTFRRWRYTVGVARYDSDYEPLPPDEPFPLGKS